MDKHSKPSILNTVSHMDIFDLCDCLQDESIDMILCDLPYGITACSWDTVIPFEPMWECFKRVIKPRGAVVLTASQPFTSKLVMSNLEWFRSEWVWDKVLAVGFQISAVRQMMQHENVLVFGYPSVIFYPQKQKRAKHRWSGGGGGSVLLANGYRSTKRTLTEVSPKSIIKVSNAVRGYHPTQKPVALFEYLIRTYTQPGGVVFDPTCGSGTTAIAARNTGRNYICGDSSEEYVQVARDRLALPYTLPMFEEAVTEDAPVQAVMGL